MASHGSHRGRGRGGLIAAFVVLIVLGIGVVSMVIIRPGPVDAWLDGAQRATPGVSTPAELPPSPVLAVANAGAPVPSAAGVSAVLDPLMADRKLGSRVSASVVDVATGASLYARGPDVLATPASTTKLVTAVTVLATRGPDHRILTRAVAGAGPGEVVLVGGGDPTLAASATPSYLGAARLDQLAAQVRTALGGLNATKVIIDVSLYSGPTLGPGWDADIATGGFGAPTTALTTDGARVDPKKVKAPADRFRQPDLAAGQAFAKALGLPVGAVGMGKAPAGAAASAPAIPSQASARQPGDELGRVESLPVSRLVEIMLSDSDNVVAEALARQVALAKGQPASYAGAAAAMSAVLTELGLAAAEGTLADGSGLSRNNRITPSLLTDLLALAGRRDRPDLHPIFAGLPVAGFSGTLRDRFRSPGPSRPGAGLVRAKTGTLTGVNAISGIVTTRDGRVLAFAVLADRTSWGLGAQDALDRIATSIAGCGCP